MSEYVRASVGGGGRGEYMAHPIPTRSTSSEIFLETHTGRAGPLLTNVASIAERLYHAGFIITVD